MCQSPFGRRTSLKKAVVPACFAVLTLGSVPSPGSEPPAPALVQPSATPISGLYVWDGQATPTRLKIVPEVAGFEASGIEAYTVFGFPAWSPKGDRIAFNAWKPEAGNAQLFVIDVTPFESGFAVTSVRAFGEGLKPSWSPGGSRIAFTAADDGGVWVRDVACDNCNERKHRIRSLGVVARWSPGPGKLIAYVTGPEFHVADLIEGKDEIVGELDVLRGGRPLIRWSPDGSSIWIQVHGETETAVYVAMRQDGCWRISDSPVQLDDGTVDLSFRRSLSAPEKYNLYFAGGDPRACSPFRFFSSEKLDPATLAEALPELGEPVPAEMAGISELGWSIGGFDWTNDGAWLVLAGNPPG